jgi:hypothetical protein
VRRRLGASYFALDRGSDGTFTDASGFGDGAFALRVTGVDDSTLEESFRTSNQSPILRRASLAAGAIPGYRHLQMEGPKPDQADVVTEIVDDVIEDFAHLLPPDLTAEARALILDALAAHPVARLYAARLQERAVPERSGSEAREADESNDRKAGGEDS